MKHGPIVGYIVAGFYGPQTLSQNYPGAKRTILTSGGMATLFPTRVEAKSAIARTDEYAAKKGFKNKPWTEHRIVAVRGAPHE